MLVLSCAAMRAGVAYPLGACDGVVERMVVGPRTNLLFSVNAANSLRAPSACRHHTGQIVTEWRRHAQRSASHPSYLPAQQRHLRPSYFLTPRDTARVEGSDKHRRMSQTFAKEKPSALYLVDQSEIRGRNPLEKRRERNAVTQRGAQHFFEASQTDRRPRSSHHTQK